MRALIVRLIIAALLFAAGAAAWSEAQVARRVANAYQRLATLRFDVDDRIGSATSALDRLPLQMETVGTEVRRHRASVAYWRKDYSTLTAPLEAADQAVVNADPVLSLARTNAAFKTNLSQLDDPNVLDRFETIANDYAEILRRDPNQADAAFNYEFVIKFRDRIAKMRPRDRVAKGPLLPIDPIPSVDLPVGPTMYGAPGGPPPELPGAEFKTLTPMPAEERDDVDPGRGVAPRRRG
jgi:hypothetical protein